MGVLNGGQTPTNCSSNVMAWQKDWLRFCSMDCLFYLQPQNIFRIGMINCQEFYLVIDVVFKQS